MKKGIQKVLVMLLALSMTFSTMALPAFADDVDPADPGTGTVTEEPAAGEVAPIDAVKAMIEKLPNCGDVTEADREAIEAAQEAYEALSEEDQATLDTQSGNYAYETGQPYGRVLETALWGLWSLNPVDNSTTLAPGTYDANTTPALSSSYSKGKSTSGRQKPWGVESITVDENQNVTGIIYVESGTYTGLIYQGQTYEMTKVSDKLCKSEPVPIDLNSTFYISGISSSMGIPIAFSISTEIDEPVPPVPLEITNNTGMFKAVSAYLTTEDDQEYLVMALSGSGYHELFKGTYEEAVENGDGSAENGNDSWVHGYQNADGMWEFKIPLNTEDTYVPCVAVSNSYYTKYLNGQNPLARVFYPRQFTLDREAKTLVTDDFKSIKELNVTNNVSMFVVNTARLDKVGGPNSNGYSSTLVLTMGSTSYDKMYIGRAGEAEKAATTIPLAEDNTFSAKVMWMKTAGQPDTITSLIGEPFVASFHSVKKDQWYERKITINADETNVQFDSIEYADYTAVDAALAKVPEDLNLYTEETAQAVTDAVNAVDRMKYPSEQEEVDAMAQAINDAVDALVPRIDITDAVIGGLGDVTVTGEAIEPPVTVTLDGKALTAGEDYTVEYANNVEVGTAIVTIKGIGLYMGEIEELFEIRPDITGADEAKDTLLEKLLMLELEVDSDLYTKASYDAYKAAKDRVDALIDNEWATKAEIEQAYKDYLRAAWHLVKRVSIEKATITGVANVTYTGKVITPKPVVKVTVDGKTRTLVEGKDYTVTLPSGRKNAGTYKVTIKGVNDFNGTVTKAFKITKAANPVKASGKTATVSASKVKTASQTIAKAKAFTISKAQGTVTFAKSSGNAKITVSKDGKITVKKGLKAGTYKIKVKVTAAGNTNYNKVTKTVTVTVKVK